MHTIHSGLTIAAAVNTSGIGGLTNFLQKLKQDNLLKLERTATTLYASIVLLPAQKYQQQTLPPTLMFFTSYSGPFQNHLEELMDHCADILTLLFSYCEGFPKDAVPAKALRKFIAKHRYASTFYSGMNGITATDIEREELLHKEIEQYINRGQEQNEFDGMCAIQIQKCIQEQIKSKGAKYEWANEPGKKTAANFWALYGKAVAFGAVLFLIIVSAFLYIPFRNPTFFIPIVLLVLFLIFSIAAIRIIESGEQQVAGRLSDEGMRIISASQSHPIVNEMTAAGPVKKGLLRRFIFIGLLKIVSALRGTIVIPTVCTARWVALNGGRRLIFISNFTNQADSYVRDFIGSPGSAKGINLLFGHGEGYPKTKWLRLKGSLDNPEGFMNVFHQNQYVTQYWFAPFKNLTVDVILKNRKIRNGLFAGTNAEETQRWLNLL